MSTYMDLPDENLQLFTCGIVYKTDKETVIEYSVDANFAGGWAQSDSNNAENSMLCMGYVIM